MSRILKAGWSLEHSTSSGKMYYFNRVTSESFYADHMRPPPFRSLPTSPIEDGDDGCIPPPPSSPESEEEVSSPTHNGFDHDRQFLTMDEVKEYCSLHGKLSGFTLYISTFKDIKGDMARLRCECKNKSSDGCGFLIRYSHNRRIGKFVLVEAKLFHNHDRERNTVPIDGKVLKTNWSDLASNEKFFIEEMCTVLDTYKLRNVLAVKFPTADYSSKLLHNCTQRMKKKNKDDGSGINKLMDFGKHLSSTGGLFSFKCDDNMKISDIVIQSKLSMNYMRQYSDFIIGDGTHGMNIHGMILIPMVIIDALGKSRIGGYIICQSESFP